MARWIVLGAAALAHAQTVLFSDLLGQRVPSAQSAPGEPRTLNGIFTCPCTSSDRSRAEAQWASECCDQAGSADSNAYFHFRDLPGPALLPVEPQGVKLDRIQTFGRKWCDTEECNSAVQYMRDSCTTDVAACVARWTSLFRFCRVPDSDCSRAAWDVVLWPRGSREGLRKVDNPLSWEQMAAGLDAQCGTDIGCRWTGILQLDDDIGPPVEARPSPIKTADQANSRQQTAAEMRQHLAVTRFIITVCRVNFRCWMRILQGAGDGMERSSGRKSLTPE